MARRPKAPPAAQPEDEFDDDPETAGGALDFNQEADDTDDYDSPDPEQHQPEPPPRPAPAFAGVPAPVAGQTGGTRTPDYLAELLAQPGIGVAALDGVNPATAWVQIESTNGASTLCPLAWLAPDALDVLADKGHAGHTTFEVRKAKAGPTLGYFATMLDELEPDPADEAGAEAATEADAQALGLSPALAQMMAHQRNEIAQLKALLQMQAAQAQADPMAGLEKSLALLDRFAGVVGKMAGFLPQPAPQQQSDLGAILDVAGKVMPLLQGGNEAPPAGDPQP